ncbi:hypothetical protein V5E97_08875 [Singulisphaera sp. Ch08]|uniref:DUF4013 domain-containing protein n=1 Tax=Singulisphaera sp. Ch08 TaxID=3120278 RepID=A0AAU7CM96_9BACT
MIEADDRLVGDPVWELFPDPTPAPGQDAGFVVRCQYGLATAVLVALAWLLTPVLSVVTVCLAVAAPDFRASRRIARSIPDKAGGRICLLFTWAWGALKLGMAAFTLMFLIIIAHVKAGGRPDVPSTFLAALVLWLAGATTSAALTAAGLVKACRSGMRVWVGAGINRARTLLLGMLVAGFAYVVLVPMCVWLAAVSIRPGEHRGNDLSPFLGFLGCVAAGPIAVVLTLDWFSRRVVADRPGKFGPKVPAVGKWGTVPTDSAEL